MHCGAVLLLKARVQLIALHQLAHFGPELQSNSHELFLPLFLLQDRLLSFLQLCLGLLNLRSEWPSAHKPLDALHQLNRVPCIDCQAALVHNAAGHDGQVEALRLEEILDSSLYETVKLRSRTAGSFKLGSRVKCCCLGSCAPGNGMAAEQTSKSWNLVLFPLLQQNTATCLLQ